MVVVVETRVTSRCKVIRVIAGTRVADFDTVVKRNVKENVAGVVQRSDVPLVSRRLMRRNVDVVT